MFNGIIQTIFNENVLGMYWHVVFWKWWFQILKTSKNIQNHVHHVQHSSRARRTVLSLQICLSLTRNNERKSRHRAVFIYFAKYRNCNTDNFSLTVSIHDYIVEGVILWWKLVDCLVQSHLRRERRYTITMTGIGTNVFHAFTYSRSCIRPKCPCNFQLTVSKRLLV